MRRYSKIAIGMMTLLLGASCADTTPLPFGGADAGAQEGGTVPEAVIESCRQCAFGASSTCESSYNECAADPRCLEFMTCILEFGCLAPGELQQRISCAEPCFVQVSIRDGTDVALQKGLGLNACTLPNGPCGSACVIE